MNKKNASVQRPADISIIRAEKILLIITVLFIMTFQAVNAQEFETPGSEFSVRDLLEIQKRTPKSDTYYLMALSEARKNNIEAAEKAIKTGLQINPRNTRLMNLKAALLARQGRLAEARSLFITVLQLDPEDRYARTSLASVERILQPERRALPVLTRQNTPTKENAPQAPVTLKPAPTEKKVLEASYFAEIKDKQDCYHSMSSIKRAQTAFVKANPARKDEFSLTTLVSEKLLTAVPVCPNGGSYSWKTDDVACSTHGTSAEAGAEVSNVFNEFNNGMRSKLSRNYLDALKSFEQVVILYPRWAEAHFQLADTLFRLGETDPAINALRNCLKYDSDNLDAQLLLANLYFKKGQKDAALKILDSVTEKHRGTVYGLAARSVATSIRSGRNYYQIFPPN
ncbi:MAG: tetratricopeptide repeat protein [Candidatus Riflebacteria bacterium]|nr:tetratricopeptide repeat protein [Candidatus Riflebacteria bacterium]